MKNESGQISKKDLKPIGRYIYEIAKTFRSDMRVPARLYASEKLMVKIFEDRSLGQLINTATLPGIQKYAMAMPDVHEGFGPPIGGVFATKLPDGIITPGGIGYDINCGTRLLTSQAVYEEIKPHIKEVIEAFFAQVPTGVGSRGPIVLTNADSKEVLENGANWAIKKGYGSQEDLARCEANGKMEGAEADKVSEKAKKRGRDQVGTLGSGNHFLELQRVDKIYNPSVAEKFGLFENQITILIHTGSRGLGHQVCTDYVNVMREAMQKYEIKVPDIELACAPLSSKEGQNYFAAMAASANFAWTNRQVLAHYARRIFKEVVGAKLGKDKTALTMVYDVAHNIAKKEEGLLVHRKGATRAFPPGHSELPSEYKDVGQPVIIPGSMGTGSYILVGDEQGKQAFYSTCHGAGRVMSRGAAKRKVWGQTLVQELEKKGIIIRSRSMAGLAEEAPLAYKDIDEVVRVVNTVGLAKKVARLVPLGVIKG